MTAITHLTSRIVEKPWGRNDVPAAFGKTAGLRVGEVWFEDPLGDAAPLMVKFLFTSERLSIQVHPDDNAARSAGYPRGKEECWLVLAAEPGAELGVGLTRQSDALELRAAAQNGGMEDLIDWRSVRAGDFVYNAAGTIHAIGPGLTIVEVQQNVDCTWRLYDYGRPRELHLDAALSVAHPGPVADPRDCHVLPSETVTLVAGPHFHLTQVVGPLRPEAMREAVDVLVVPLGRGTKVGGMPLDLGSCVRISSLEALEMENGATALLAWPA